MERGKIEREALKISKGQLDSRSSSRPQDFSITDTFLCSFSKKSCFGLEFPFQNPRLRSRGWDFAQPLLYYVIPTSFTSFSEIIASIFRVETSNSVVRTTGLLNWWLVRKKCVCGRRWMKNCDKSLAWMDFISFSKGPFSSCFLFVSQSLLLALLVCLFEFLYIQSICFLSMTFDVQLHVEILLLIYPFLMAETEKKNNKTPSPIISLKAAEAGEIIATLLSFHLAEEALVIFDENSDTDDTASKEKLKLQGLSAMGNMPVFNGVIPEITS